jgi:hypothetical protein
MSIASICIRFRKLVYLPIAQKASIIKKNKIGHHWKTNILKETARSAEGD